MLGHIWLFSLGYKQRDELITKLLTSASILIIPALDLDGFALAMEGDCDDKLYRGGSFAESFPTDTQVSI